MCQLACTHGPPVRPVVLIPAVRVQLVGTSGTITPAADIYSFGCCMLTMCVNGRTSAPPGAAHEPVGFLKQGITRSTDLAPFVPPELDSILKVRSTPPTRPPPAYHVPASSTL